MVYYQKITIFILSALMSLTLSCRTGQTVKNDANGDDQTRDEVSSDKENVRLGWSDPDTYTVSVSGENEEIAKQKAINKILKDIVKVRVMNQSQYTDISKIQDEFEEPLRNGRVLDKKKGPGGLIIHFQIHGKNLKMKFERK